MCGYWTTDVVIDLLCTYWTAVWLLNLQKELLSCDRACISNITADHFYSVRAKKQSIFDLVEWSTAINEVQGTRSPAKSKQKMDQSLHWGTIFICSEAL